VLRAVLQLIFLEIIKINDVEYKMRVFELHQSLFMNKMDVPERQHSDWYL
jgi:hypothetical protein